MKRTLGLLIAAAGLLILASPPALADGCYIPEKAVQKLPEIPAQRALVSFRDGKETLIVESALEGQGKKFGWVIPVPARPDAIEAATPGTLKSLAMGIQPEIVHDRGGDLADIIAICVIGLFLTSLVAWGHRKGLGIAEGLPVVGVVLILAAVLLPSLGAAHRGTFPDATAGLTVLDAKRVGSYEVTVLAVDDASALYKWLEAEELAIPEALRPAADDYAKRGWKFVAARLATDGSGSALPHPLRISFPTSRAVYPMKFTALSGRALDLELYVVGDAAASAPGLKRVFCDRFRKQPVDDLLSIVLLFPWPLKSEESFLGSDSFLDLGHPGLKSVLWDGCWVTKLAGKLAPAAMGEDFQISWGAPRFERPTLYSSQGAMHTALLWSVPVLSLVAALAAVLWGWRKLRIGSALRLALAGALAAAALFALVGAALPRVEVRPFRQARAGSSKVLEVVFMAREKLRAGESFEATVRRLLVEGNCENVYTGKPIREDDSPGNYTLAEKDGKLLFTLYDLGGTPLTVELGAKP